MKDFTLKKYGEYLSAIKASGIPFYRYDEFLEQNLKEQDSFCLIRHDVDRRPSLSLDMAKLEHSMGIKSSYYFRIKPVSYKKSIIKEIASLGHEIGYHYECLSDSDGDIPKALDDFKVRLADLRKIASIKTCCMHGRPFKPHDNREIWRVKENHDILLTELKMLGELYLDIDYSDISYINDTGRNWSSTKSNRRDKVESNMNSDFESSDELLKFFKTPTNRKIVFQIHPERWSDSPFEWYQQYLKDALINFIKKLLR